MKLARVRFSVIQKLEGGLSSDEVVATDDKPIEFRPAEQVVAIGAWLYPIASVRSMVKEPDITCNVCGDVFETACALGSHLRFAHKVLGKKAQAKKEKGNG